MDCPKIGYSLTNDWLHIRSNNKRFQIFIEYAMGAFATTNTDTVTTQAQHTTLTLPNNGESREKKSFAKKKIDEMVCLCMWSSLP